MLRGGCMRAGNNAVVNVTSGSERLSATGLKFSSGRAGCAWARYLACLPHHVSDQWSGFTNVTTRSKPAEPLHMCLMTPSSVLPCR